MVPTRTEKPGKIGEHFPVGGKLGNFAKTRKVREFYPKYWESPKKMYWKIEKKYTGKVKEICQALIVKTLQIWYHTLCKKF